MAKTVVPKIVAMRDGVTRRFAVQTWNSLPPDKYGWKPVSTAHEKPTHTTAVPSVVKEATEAVKRGPKPKVIEGDVNAD